MLAELVELAPGGVEEVHAADHVEYAIYGTPGELPELPDLEVAAGDGLVSIATTEVADDWADRWRDFHKPVVIGSRIAVLPSWERDREREPLAEIEIEIDPGRAFGTGSHATTTLCLGLLAEVADAGGGGPLADLGCGSGILAIAAAKLGYAPVLGCDNERASVEIARVNAERNGVGGAVFERVDLRRDPIPTAPVVAANLTGPLLIEVAGRLAEGAARPGDRRPDQLVVSGLLARERDAVASAFGRLGYSVDEARELGEWAGLSMTG